MPVTVVVTEVEQVADGWGDLLPSCWTNTVFVTPWWQTTWLNHFGDRSTARTIATTNGDGALVGIASMNVTDGLVTFLGDTDLFDYRDFLVRRGGEDAFYPGRI